VRTVPVTRLFRLGVSLIHKVRRLATTLLRRGPFSAAGRDLAEPDEALVLEAVARHRPMLAGIIDDPPAGADRPFRSLPDLARATAAIERVAAAQALLLGLGVTPANVAEGSPLLDDTGTDDAALDAGVLARTALVHRLLAPASASRQTPAAPLEPLTPDELRDFEALLEERPEGPPRLPEVLARKARTILEAATPPSLAGAAAAVADRWLAGLAPLEPVLVRHDRNQPP
jgi:hypothetical protein